MTNYRDAATVAETVPARHETPDVAELRRLLDDMRALATREGVYNGNRAVLDIIARVEPLLGDADALRAELAHMTEARDNARAEVERLAGRLDAVRALHSVASAGMQYCIGCGAESRVIGAES